MRIVHIQRDPQSPPADPRYDILDTGRYKDEESGAADVLHSLRRQQVGDWLAREGTAYSAIERVLAELQQTESAQVELAARVGPRILRAWFDTVINPLAQSLESELVLLDRRNWTFSFRPAKLELIRPLRGYVAHDASANLDQILRSEIPLEATASTHDDSVEHLRGNVTLVHEQLAKTPRFTALCDSLMAPDKLQELGVGSLFEVFGAYPPSDRYDLIAQYVVNSTGVQASHYSTATFWNLNREVLMQALEFPGIREHHASAVRMSEHLASVTRDLVAQFKTLREQLSLRHDVPLVTGGP